MKGHATLYPANATEKMLNSNGLGVLSDCISGTVTRERNGEYEIEFEYPIDGAHFSDIALGCLVKAEPEKDHSEQIFEIYAISKPKNGKCTINGEHVSYRLNRVTVEPFETTGASPALAGLVTHSIGENPFTTWTDIENTTTQYTQTEPATFRGQLGGVEGSILDIFGGEYDFDNYTVKLYKAMGTDRGVTVEYGKNLIDLKQEESIQDTITGIVPYWIDNEGKNLVMLSEKVIECANAGNFPYKRTIPHDFSQEFQDKPTEEQLRKKAQAYVKANVTGVPDVSITVSAQNLADTEEYKNLSQEIIRLCDTVTVKFLKLGVNATAKVVSIEYDFINRKIEKFTIGSARSNLAQAIAGSDKKTQKSIDKSASSLQQALNGVKKMLMGGYGGHVVPSYNADKQMNAIYVIDTTDPATAVKGLAINMNGIGGFTDGISGDVNVAITIDGQIVADRITTGTLRAIDIEGVNITGSTITFGTTGKTVIVSSTKDMNGVVFNGEGEIRIQTRNTTYYQNYEQDGTVANSFSMVAYDGYGAGTNQLELYNYWDGKYANLMEFQSNDTNTETFMINEDYSHLRPPNGGPTGYENLILMASNSKRKSVTLKNAMFNAPATANTIDAWATASLEAVGLFNFCGKEHCVNQIIARRENNNYDIGLYNSYNGDRQSNQLILRARGNTRNEVLIRNLDLRNGGNFASLLDMYSSADGNVIDLANYQGGNRVARIYFFNSGSLTLESTKIFDVSNQTRSVINSNVNVDGGAVQLYNGKYTGSAVISSNFGAGRHAITLGWNGSRLILYVDATFIGYVNTSR